MAARNQLGFTQEEELIRKQVNYGPSLRSTFISLIPLSTVFILLRFTARRIAKTPLWWDDWLAVIAWIAAVALNVILITAVDQGGLGKHAEFAGPGPLVYGLKILFASEIIYQFSMTCIKLSILLFYFRIFRISKYFNNALWVMSTVTLCWYCTSTFVIVFQCKPVSFLWNHTLPGGTCVPQERLWIGSSVTSLLTDVAVLCVPMPAIWKLRATRNQKVALSAIFLLGAFVCITSIIRLSKINNLNVLDPSISYVSAAIWTSVECSVAVISACLPTLKPLFRTIFEITDVLPFDAPRKHSDGQNTNFSSSPDRSRSAAGGAANPPAVGYVNRSPDPRAKQWRAHANARRIRELGEYRTDEAGHHYVNETGVWEDDEKRYIPSGYVDRQHHHHNGNGRKFAVAGGLKEKFSRSTLAKTPRTKRSAETMVEAAAAPTTHHKSARKSYLPPTKVSRNGLGGGHTGLGIEVREDSPHLWNRVGERSSWTPVALGGFDFELDKNGRRTPVMDGAGGRRTPGSGGWGLGKKRGVVREESEDSEVTVAGSGSGSGRRRGSM